MPPNVGQVLPRTTPEQHGIASESVRQFVDALERVPGEVHSFMLLRHGNVMAEGWWSPYERDAPHLAFSLSKSFTSTAVGFAIAEGYFALDDAVVSFFPEDALAFPNDRLARMSVRHLLSMSTGQEEDTWSSLMLRTDGNWIKGFFEVPVLREPGTHFVYNTGATYVLSAIVQKTTGMKLIDYLEPRLFAPLGIKNATWQESPQGVTAGGIGLSLKTEDIARFGQLYLQKGQWQGRQLLAQAWIAEATATQILNRNDAHPDWGQGYGYQFWRCRHGAYNGNGVFGQYCIIMPQQDAVLAITAGLDVFDMQAPLDAVWNLLLPAMGAEPLPDDPLAHSRLTEKLSGLALPPAQGRVSSPLTAQLSGRVYRVDANDPRIETICLDFAESGCLVRVQTAADEETIPCGYGAWERGYTGLFSQPVLYSHTPFAASGAWTADDTFLMLLRLYETPFFYTLAFYFAGDDLLIDVRVNVSLESLAPLLLTARAA